MGYYKGTPVCVRNIPKIILTNAVASDKVTDD